MLVVVFFFFFPALTLELATSPKLLFFGFGAFDLSLGLSSVRSEFAGRVAVSLVCLVFAFLFGLSSDLFGELNDLVGVDGSGGRSVSFSIIVVSADPSTSMFYCSPWFRFAVESSMFMFDRTELSVASSSYCLEFHIDP